MAAAAATTAPTPADSGRRTPVVNFSRPRLASNDPDRMGQQGDVKSVQAFHESNTRDSDDWPSEPRFSIDSETVTNTSHNARRGGPVGGVNSQRHPGTQRQISNSTSNSSGGSSTRPGTSDSLKQLLPIKSILKHTSVDVSSESGEDSNSHHTVSENGGSNGSSDVGFERNGKWSSSDHDTSAMSQREMEKLEKKGKNPALVAEMKAAKGGKNKLVGVMTGTAYVS